MRLIDADALEPTEILSPRGNGQYENTQIVYMDDIDDMPSIDPESCLDDIVSEIQKTIDETRWCGKHHASYVRHNGEMICHGLEIALKIIEEKRNERFD